MYSQFQKAFSNENSRSESTKLQVRPSYLRYGAATLQKRALQIEGW